MVETNNLKILRRALDKRKKRKKISRVTNNDSIPYLNPNIDKTFANKTQADEASSKL